jgi:hypothetical protein
MTYIYEYEWYLDKFSALYRDLSESAKGLLSRVWVTMTRVWIGESVYWIFTSCNYNWFLHSKEYCTNNYSTQSLHSTRQVFTGVIQTSRGCLLPRTELNCQGQSHIATEGQSVSHSVSLGVETQLGLMTRYWLLFDGYGLVIVGCLLWREDGSVFYQSHCLQ